MKKMINIFLCTLIVSNFCLLNAQAVSNWTIMIYLDADNNLESDGIDDFLEIATEGSDENINFIVQMDRIDNYSNKYGDWTDCKRFRIEKNMTPTPENALESLGEVNMGDPGTLFEFVQWAMTLYPSQQYALVLWDHGDGWQRKINRQVSIKGICWDDTNGSNEFISMLALKNILESLSIKPILVGFDACLMGMVENAYLLKQAGISVMVASEETEPAAGWPYHLICQGLVSHPEWQAAQLGDWIVAKYYQSYNLCQTLSAIDLTQLNPLIMRLAEFATSLSKDWQENMNAIKIQAQSLRMCIDNAVISSQNGNAYQEAGGLSIYFPTKHYHSFYDQTELAKKTKWNVFLADFINTMSSSWIDFARKQTLSFDDTDIIDLYHFCRCLELHEPDDYLPHYSAEETDYNFEDIQVSGKKELIDDENYIAIDLQDFLFQYHDNTYKTFYISDNGVIFFDNIDWNWGWSNNTFIPTDNAFNDSFIAPLWDDYNGATVFWEVKNNFNNTCLIIQWQDLSHYEYVTTSNITFQAILYENGRIGFQYKQTNFNNELINNGNSATVGVQGTITSGLQYSVDQPWIKSPFALMFIPDNEKTCHYTLASYYHNLASEGELCTVLLRTENNCKWEATSEVDWIHIVSKKSGIGPSKIQFQVSENINLEPRIGKLDIANQHLIINQASSCTYDIIPLKQTVPASGGMKQFSITVSLETCPWSVESLVSWIIPIETLGAGSFILNYSVANNPTTNKRTGIIKLNDTTLTVIQDAADAPEIVLLENQTHIKNLSLFLGERSFYKIEVPPGNDLFQINTNGGNGDCDIYVSFDKLPTEDVYDYAASEYHNDERIYILEPNAGIWYIMLHAYERFQNVNFYVCYQTHQCEYTLFNQFYKFESVASSASFQVVTNDTCYWSISSENSWIKFVNIENIFHGSATVHFNILENTSLTQRIGHIKIADQYIQIVQGGCQNIVMTTLKNGVPKYSLSGSKESYQFFKILVPENQEAFQVDTWGGHGDCDLYVRFSEIPDLDISDHASNNYANDETITIQSPQSGEYYIMLYGYWSYDNVTINVKFYHTHPSQSIVNLIQVLRFVTDLENSAIDVNGNGRIDIDDAIIGMKTRIAR